jgi:hypothetical protein
MADTAGRKTAGGQSPPPEDSTNSQIGQPSSGPTSNETSETGTSDTNTKGESDDTKNHGLESNPASVLDEVREAKFSKDG